MPFTADDSLGIVDLMQELRRRCGRAPTYSQVWNAIARGEIPAERVNSRWRVQRADLPRVEAALGLTIAA